MKKIKNLLSNLEPAIAFLLPICFILAIFSIESIAMSYINHSWLSMVNWFTIGFVSVVTMLLVSRRLNIN